MTVTSSGAPARGGDDAEQVRGQLDGGGVGPVPQEGAQEEPEPRGGAEPLHGLDAAGGRGRARRPAAAGRRRRAKHPHRLNNAMQTLRYKSFIHGSNSHF